MDHTGLVLFILLWAYFSELDIRTSASGKVIPSSEVKQIENLEGGILSELLTKEGSIVAKGQILLKLDNTRFNATYEENLINSYALKAKLIRLQGEVDGVTELIFPEILHQNYPKLVQNELNLFKSNQINHQSRIETLQQKYTILEEQYNILVPLEKDQIVSKMEVLESKKELNQAKGELLNERQSYLSLLKSQIVETQLDKDALNKALKRLKDRMERTIVKSPIDGIVKKININTIGGVIQPGESIIEIVPLNDLLLIEAKIPPALSILKCDT